jgi:PPOX class probable F420-dependent enzyme
MPRNDQLSAGAIKLLREPHLAVVCTLMPDGSPQATPTWVDVEDDGSHILINTVSTHLKVRNIDRDPRVSVTVLDSENAFRNVIVRGRVVEKRGPDEGSVEHIHALARKYMGREYPLRDGEERVILRIKPDHVLERGTSEGERRGSWGGQRNA